MWEKLKSRWNVESGVDVFLILLVFACTGTSVLYVKKIVFGWMDIDEQTATWIRICLSLFIILPLYQVILLGWGWLFGKFNFFWEFEKRSLFRMRDLWRKKS
jgi:hypothetical protein